MRFTTVLIMQKTMLIVQKNPGLLIIFSLIQSNPYLYERTVNLLGGNLQIKLALTCEG